MATTMTANRVTIEVLTAEVRVLMVGSRQVTLSVFRQLDWVDPDDCEPLGRVNDAQSKAWNKTGLMVGRHVTNGTLVRAAFTYQPLNEHDEYDLRSLRLRGSYLAHEKVRLADLEDRIRHNQRWDAAEASYDALPLIVLAGLK